MNHYKRTHKIFIIVSLCIQGVIILYLLNAAVTKFNERQTQYTTTLNKDQLTFSQTPTLKHYFELAPRYKNEPLSLIPSWLGYTPHYTINNDNMNDLYNYPITKVSDVYRIVLIGDSVTFGLYVDTKDNYSEIFEALLNNTYSCPQYKKFEVLNIGMPGYDVEYMLERFKRTGLKYNPDLVLWHVQEGSFRKVQDLILEKLKKNQEKDPEKSAQIAFIAQQEVEKELGIDAIIQRQFNALSSIDNYFTGPLVILLSEKSYSLQDKEKLDMFAKKRKNTKIAVIPVEFGKNGLRLPDKHPNKKGHEAFGIALYEYFTKNNISHCIK